MNQLTRATGVMNLDRQRRAQILVMDVILTIDYLGVALATGNPAVDAGIVEGAFLMMFLGAAFRLALFSNQALDVQHRALTRCFRTLRRVLIVGAISAVVRFAIEGTHAADFVCCYLAAAGLVLGILSLAVRLTRKGPA